MNDEELTRLAEEELLKEARRAAARAEIIGPEGWRKCPSRNVNKRFLVSTIRDAVYTNKRVKFNHKNVYYRESSINNKKVVAGGGGGVGVHHDDELQSVMVATDGVNNSTIATDDDENHSNTINDVNDNGDDYKQQTTASVKYRYQHQNGFDEYYSNNTNSTTTTTTSTSTSNRKHARSKHRNNNNSNSNNNNSSSSRRTPKVYALESNHRVMKSYEVVDKCKSKRKDRVK